MENMKICQSCGMPMSKPEEFGTNADGSKNEEYCCYCWVNGAFDGWCKDMTLEEMIENGIRFVIEAKAAETENEARAMLKESIPKLKRWAVA